MGGQTTLNTENGDIRKQKQVLDVGAISWRIFVAVCVEFLCVNLCVSGNNKGEQFKGSQKRNMEKKS